MRPKPEENQVNNGNKKLKLNKMTINNVPLRRPRQKTEKMNGLSMTGRSPSHLSKVEHGLPSLLNGLNWPGYKGKIDKEREENENIINNLFRNEKRTVLRRSVNEMKQKGVKEDMEELEGKEALEEKVEKDLVGLEEGEDTDGQVNTWM